MKILSIKPTPLHEIRYQTAVTHGKSSMTQLPILVGVVDRLPPSVEAIICMSDLQGIESASQSYPPRLLAEVVAEELNSLSSLGLLPHPEHIGVILAGDFYSASSADQRGADGDVRSAWLGFQQRFQWVAGVPGNHDRFGTTNEHFQTFVETEHLYYLDGNTRDIAGLLLAGLGGIIGNSSKPMRRSERDYVLLLNQLIRSKIDLLVLHESPALPESSHLGSATISTILQKDFKGLVICGHCHWQIPLATLHTHCQVLNVDARVVVLTE